MKNRLSRKNLLKVVVSVRHIGFRLTYLKIKSFLWSEKLVSVSDSEPAKSLEKKSNMDPWRFITPLRPINVLVIDKIEQSECSELEILLIIPCKNEKSNIELFLKNLEKQLLNPSRIIFIDGFSTDGTYELLLAFSKSRQGVIVHQSSSPPGLARNEAWETGRKFFAELDYVIYMDMGCEYDSSYISSLVSALEIDGDSLVSCCTFGFKGPNETLATFKQNFQEFTRDDWAEWLPSIRGFCIKVSRNPDFQWPLMPDWVEFAGDDTLYALQVRNNLDRWIVLNPLVPLVIWHVPGNIDFAAKVLDRYWFGDGQTGARDHIVKYLSEPWVTSHQRGLDSRPKVDVLERKVFGVYIIFSLTSLADSGGSHRPAQLCQELTKAGYRVIFVNLTDTNEQLSGSIWFAGDISLLTVSHFSDQIWMNHVVKYIDLGLEISIVVSAPHPKFLNAVNEISRIENAQTHLIYDVIDDFSPRGLNSNWYDEAIEVELTMFADTTICVTKSLSEKFQVELGVTSMIIGNAVPTSMVSEIQKQLKKYPQTTSLDSVKFTYAGAIWGFWFDWEILKRLGDLSSSEIFVFGEHNFSRENEFKKDRVKFYGLLPQIELVQHYLLSDFLIIPFEDTDFTSTISPLKFFEYLISERPILYSGKFIPDEFLECSCITRFDSFFLLLENNDLYEVREKLTSQMRNCKMRTQDSHNHVPTWLDNAKAFIGLKD